LVQFKVGDKVKITPERRRWVSKIFKVKHPEGRIYLVTSIAHDWVRVIYPPGDTKSTWAHESLERAFSRLSVSEVLGDI
jgi:hypothetical protein